LSFKRRVHDRYLPEFKRERYEKASTHVRFDQPATQGEKKKQLTIFLMTDNSSSALLASRDGSSDPKCHRVWIHNNSNNRARRRRRRRNGNAALLQ
jgi:hypothetical protein